MTPVEKCVILGYAENDMDASKTARNKNYHRNTIEYHLDRIAEKYGLNPRKFYDLVKLVALTKGSE